MLPENLYALRRKSGLSQEQLAEEIGVSRQAISKWETGLSTPELGKLKALSGYFGVTIDQLTGSQAAGSLKGGANGKGLAPRAPRESWLGACLCAAGAVCLLAFGLLALVRPSSVHQVSESSAITLNGAGILTGLCLLAMALGLALIMKKK